MSGIDTYVVIPFKDEPGLTSSILEQLCEQDEYQEILLFDNGSREESLDEIDVFLGGRDITLLSRPDAGIYQMWNEGRAIARERAGGEAHNVLVLNNDITIPPAFIRTLVVYLRSDPDTWIVYPDYSRRIAEGVAPDLSMRPTQGTYQHGGMSGWAFMLKGEVPLENVDEQFEWWYGDDDLVRQATSKGKMVCRVVGLPLDHINEATANNGDNAWTHGAKDRDTQRFRAKWA